MFNLNNVKSEEDKDITLENTSIGTAETNKEELDANPNDKNDSGTENNTIKDETFEFDDALTEDKVGLDVDTGKKSSNPSPLPAADQTPREEAPLETLNIRLPQLMTIKSSE